MVVEKMTEVYDLLKDAVAFTPEETDERFKITEENGEWILKAFRYLDGPTFGKILRAISSKGGGYRKDETTKFAIFTLPKEHGIDSETTYKEVPNEIQMIPLNAIVPSQFKIRMKPEFEMEDLVESIKTYGLLHPITIRHKGELYEIVAGERRWKACKTAGLTEIPAIIRNLSDIDAFSLQLAENLQRQDLSSEEKSMALAQYAKFTKYNGRQIATALGLKEGYVYKYLPQDFKEKEFVELGQKSAQARAETAVARRATESEISRQPFQPSPSFAKTQAEMAQEVIDCEQCGQPIHRIRAVLKESKLLCPKCAGVAKPLTTRKLEKEPTFKPKDKPEFRRAVMQPQKSKFELAVIQELQVEGLPLETDVEICAVKTIPDAILRLQTGNIAIYIDNEVTHPEGNGRDEFLRDKIEVQGWKVLPVRWKNDSQEERQRAKETIREYLKW